MRSAIYMALLAAWVVPALAHGPAEWIQRGGYKNAAGELCCGPVDCMELSSSDVRAVSGGYLILSMNEFVPNNDATPGEGQSYFVCRHSGQRKCFFFPSPGT